MSAQPAEREDPLDPQRILDDLPEDERAYFLSQYREAVEGARDPARRQQLRRRSCGGGGTTPQLPRIRVTGRR